MKCVRGHRRALTGCGGALLLALTACGESTNGVQPTAAVRAVETSRVVIPGADRFTPFITVVRDGAQITFHNGDVDAHSVVSVPGSPVSFARVLKPGESWTITLTESGSYRYYCSIHARYDPSTGQVEALPNSDHANEPMEGVVVVGA